MIWLRVNLVFLILASILIVSIREWFETRWLPKPSVGYQNLFASQAIYLYSKKKLIIVLFVHALVGLVVFGLTYLIYYSSRNIIMFNNSISFEDGLSFLYISMWTISILVGVFFLNLFISYFRRAHLLSHRKTYYEKWKSKKYVYLPKDVFTLNDFQFSQKTICDLKKLINNLDKKIIKINKTKYNFLSKDCYFLMCSTLDKVAYLLSKKEQITKTTKINQFADSIFRNVYTKIYNYKKITSLTFS